jgi:predicted nucleic acid-binding protein
MAVKAVIDTNIWVSAILNPHGFPSKLREGFQEEIYFIKF